MVIRNVDDDSDCYQSAVAANGRWVTEITGEMKTFRSPLTGHTRLDKKINVEISGKLKTDNVVDITEYQEEMKVKWDRLK
jgi:hypothetical protein